MPRYLFKFAFLAGLGLTVSPVLGADQVFLRTDPKKPLVGSITQDSPAGVSIKVKSGTEQVPALAIQDVFYDIQGPGSGSIKIDAYTPARNAEADIDKATTAALRKSALDKAVSAWEHLVKSLKDTDFSNLKRHAAYKLALLKARQAKEEGTSTVIAIGLFKEFLSTHGTGWETLPAAKLLGQLLMDKKDYRDAEKVFDNLAGKKNLPQDARENFQLLSAQALIEGKDFTGALAKLQAIGDKLPRTSKQRQRVETMQAVCLAETNKLGAAEQKINALLDNPRTDREVKAMAYNALGYIHERQKLYKEALWDYLRVDVVYNQNKEEQAKALYHLAILFARLKDEDHARECKARLAGTEFAGTEYQQRPFKEE